MRTILRTSLVFFAVTIATIGLAPAGAAPSAAPDNAAVSIAPAPAPGVVPTRHGGPRRYPTTEDAQARRVTAARASASRRSTRATAAAGAFIPVGPPLEYQGAIDDIGVTTGTPQVYVVFWGQQWGTATPPGSTNFSNDPSGVAARVAALLAGIGTNGELWSGVMTQYCEGVPVGTQICPVASAHVGYPTGGALAGIWYDNSVSAPTTAGQTQIATEAINTAAHFGNTTPVSNRNAQYVVVSPTGTHPDGFNAGAHFCAWHDFTSASKTPPSPYGDIAYTNLPYVPDMGKSCGANFVNAGTAGAIDGVTIVEGHEYAETITDQNPVGGWIDQGGNENGDKCAWIGSGPGRSQDVAFATGTFAMQTTWSNDGRTCLVAHPIWGIPGLPDDFAIDTSPRSGFTQAGGAATTQLESVTAAGNPQTIALSASDLPPDATVSFSPSTMSSDGASTVTVQTAPTTPDGQYPITITVTGSVSHSATFIVIVGQVPTTLQNGVAATPVSGGAGSDQYFQIDIPLGFHETDFTIAGGTGDADLYIEQDTLPTDNEFLCGSVNPGANLETCLAFDITGRWYVRVHGTAAFSGLAVRVTPATPTRVLSGQWVKDIAGPQGSQRYFWLRISSTKVKTLKITIGGMKGDADLYGRFGSLPSQFVNVCPPPKHGRRMETCTISFPRVGIWYFGVYGATDFSKVIFKVKEAVSRR